MGLATLELSTHLAQGEQTIIVRARDTGGGEQPSDAAEVWNPKGYMNTARHAITVHAR